MNPYLLLLISILLAVSNNLLLHCFGNRGLRGLSDILLFNSLVSCVWIAILLPLSGLKPVTVGALLWGVLYGIVTAVFLLGKMQAMATGPVSVTSFIGCSSLLISTAVGIIAFQESVMPLQILGVALLLCALFLTASPSAGGEKIKKAWMRWCVLFFFASASTGIIFKLHQSSDSRNEVGAMMLCAAVTSAVIFAAAAVIAGKKSGIGMPHIPMRAILFALACGIVSCGYNRLNITLSSALPSIVFFPVFNGAVILGASLLAAVVFREMLTRRQLAGMGIGIAALMLASGTIDGFLALL